MIKWDHLRRTMGQNLSHLLFIPGLPNFAQDQITQFQGFANSFTFGHTGTNYHRSSRFKQNWSQRYNGTFTISRKISGISSIFSQCNFFSGEDLTPHETNCN